VPNPIIHTLLSRWDRFATAQSRMRHLPPRLLRHMGTEGTILDMGGGDGHLARCLMDARPGIRVTGVDIAPRPAAECHGAVIACDGAHLPFADHTFDLVLLSDVLHHTSDPAVLLREAMRVTRRRVLIKDHYWITRRDRWLLAASDYLGNRVHGVPLPYAFLNPRDWDTLFRQCGARAIIQEQFVYSAVDRCKQVIFVIEAQDAPASETP
jgi:SAM-dependent methyltransferase